MCVDVCVYVYVCVLIDEIVFVFQCVIEKSKSDGERA